ncbi:unnamed protein product, partial [Musa textilis]
ALSAAFVFDIDTVNGSGGDSLAFVVATSKTLPGAENGQFLGLLSTRNNGNFSNHLFAIEFDTVKAIGPFADIDENHVGVDVNSLQSNVAKAAAYYANSGKKVSVELLSAQPNQAYNGGTSILYVTIAPLPLPRPRRPLMSHAIDLSPILRNICTLDSPPQPEISQATNISWVGASARMASRRGSIHLSCPFPQGKSKHHQHQELVD